MKQIKRIGILIIGMLFLMVSVVEAAEIVTNGDFSNGTANWTANTGNIVVPGGCGPGEANLSDPGTTVVISQCILITTHDTNWAFDYDLISGTSNGSFNAAFHATADCTGGPIVNLTHSRAVLPNGNFWDSAGTGAQSISVEITESVAAGPIDVCIDNISVSGAVATNVAMSDIGVQNSNNNRTILLIGLALLLAMSSVWGWRRQR